MFASIYFLQYSEVSFLRFQAAMYPHIVDHSNYCYFLQTSISKYKYSFPLVDEEEHLVMLVSGRSKVQGKQMLPSWHHPEIRDQ